VSAVAPSGPYRHVVRAGPFYICSGQIGLRDGELVAGGVVEELRQAVSNLAAVLFGEGLNLGEVVKTMVFMTDIGQFDVMNGAYMELFADPRPARTTIGVAGLPRGASIEIEAWALPRASSFGSAEEGFSSLA
jgi:2-iminobutanoate/2-iminopropanoate deaminase